MNIYYTKKGKFETLFNKDIPYSELNRKIGPALIRSNGTKEYYKNGKLHRLNGPAVISNNGRKEWWVDGKPSRVDGPAIEEPNGDHRWYLNGKRLSNNEVERWMDQNKINLSKRIDQVIFKMAWS